MDVLHARSGLWQVDQELGFACTGLGQALRIRRHSRGEVKFGHAETTASFKKMCCPRSEGSPKNAAHVLLRVAPRYARTTSRRHSPDLDTSTSVDSLGPQKKRTHSRSNKTFLSVLHHCMPRYFTTMMTLHWLSVCVAVP
jgi:hypothetical protein